MSTILITGAAGFIGSQLAHKLKDENLILIDNFSYGKYDNLEFDDVSFKDKVHNVDIRDKKEIANLFKNNKIDYVYNIAGIAPLPDCQSNPTEAIDVNITGFVNILENARIHGVKTIIQASTNAMYENDTEFPIKEESFMLPTLIYPNTKYCAERFAESYCNTYGMNIVCLRFANVYGPHIDCLRTQPPFIAYMVRELFYKRTPVFHSNGEQKRDYIYVDDLIELAIKVQDAIGFDEVNVSSNKNYSVNEMYEMAQNIMNIHIDAKYADDNHFWNNYPALYNGVYKIQENILHNEINKYTLCDNSYALEKYGWAPKIDMHEGLTRLIEYECKLLSNN